MLHLYTSFLITIKKLVVVFCIIILGSFVFLTATTVQTFALREVTEFDLDPGLVLGDDDIYSLPYAYSSPEMIQAFLLGQGSLLAQLNVDISFEPESGVINDLAFANKPEIYRPNVAIRPSLGLRISAAELIWRLTQTNLSNSCNLNLSGGQYTAGSVCYDTPNKPINPAFLLTMIQKESGLVYGVNARLDINSPQAKSLIDRVVGYYCFDSLPESSCYDQNPDWKYYKGFFRQLFYAIRLIRLREKMCQLGGQYAFRNSNGVFQVGSTVQVGDRDGQNRNIMRSIVLKNGISCSLYIYTPYIISQRNVLKVMKELKADTNLVNQNGLSPDYMPSLMTTFEQ